MFAHLAVFWSTLMFNLSRFMLPVLFVSRQVIVRRTLVLICLAAGIARGDVTLAPLFSHAGVLQRDRLIPVWGRAQPGEPIEVRFDGETARTEADGTGRWRVTLNARAASREGKELVVRGRDTVRVRDLLIGDVWLCSGQSNMAFTVYRGLNANTEIGAANFPLIRHYLIPRRVTAQPAEELSGTWQICHPDSVADFSGVAYFFARDLFLRYQVPIGLINSTWGGTQIESWMEETAVRADPSAEAIDRRWRQRLADFPAKLEKYPQEISAWQAQADEARRSGREFVLPAPAAPEGPNSRWMPAGLYNAMIAPLAPAPLRGVLWYQGEANAPRAAEYASLFRGLIRQWRAAFGQELPFYFVQLANHDRESDKTQRTWAYLREAQQAALELPRTGMAVTIDIGDVKDVHPKNKQEVGRRLALIARAQLEGEPVEFSGPRLVAVDREGSMLRIRFRRAKGLHTAGQAMNAFEIAGEDRKFFRAIARIDGETVMVMSPEVAEPVAVRYAWHNFPDACLFNDAGLPASPFRSDSW